LCVGSDSAGIDNKPSQNGPLIYLSVEGHLDDAVKAVTSSGGKVLQEKHQIGPHGFARLLSIRKATASRCIRLDYMQRDLPAR
jgi:hypothetical protein